MLPRQTRCSPSAALCRSAVVSPSPSRPPSLATLSNGTSKNLQVTTFGFSGLSAFVGEGPYWKREWLGQLVQRGDQFGCSRSVAVSGDLAVALFKPTGRTDTSSYYAVPRFAR